MRCGSCVQCVCLLPSQKQVLSAVRFAPQPHSRQLKELNIVKYGESLVQNIM